MITTEHMEAMEDKKTEILILGGGFGGLYAALRLDRTLAKRSDCRVTLVSEDNFTLFTPMLHEVAASDIDASAVVNPLRKMLKRVVFYEGHVKAIDLPSRKVTMTYGYRRTRELEYDQLLIALGSETRFFDDQTPHYALQMKTLSDAVLLRNHLIGTLESAEVEPDEQARRRLLTFVVAGGGFAGVETMGAVNDFLRQTIRYYRHLNEQMLRVILVHPGKVLLPEFSASLGEYTLHRLRDAKIDVRLETKVRSYDGITVKLEPGEDITAATLIWTAGVTPGPLIRSLPCEKKNGRIAVNSSMQLEAFPGVWVVGDVGYIPDVDGKPYPATAQHAMRQGKCVAKNIEAAIENRPEHIKPFRYKMLGQLAAIGHRRGAAQIFGIKFSGYFAWWLWRTTYLLKLPRFEKKLRVALDWTLDLIFAKDIVQFITPKEIEKIMAIGQRHLERAGEHLPHPALSPDHDHQQNEDSPSQDDRVTAERNQD
jgi:NADH dehydrogenase